MTLTAGLDIGGSSIKAVVRGSDGDVVRRSEIANDGKPVAEAAITALEGLGIEDCVGVGIGVPGRVDRSRGEVSLAVNLGIGVEPLLLSRLIEAEIGLPVVLENDVRAAAVGAYEHAAQTGEAPQSLALFSIGTGISAGVVVEGTLVRGANGMAGEVGHVVIDESGPECVCGQKGCLETLAAGPAIARAWPGSDYPATALFAAAVNGDPDAGIVAARIAGHVTTALTWLAASYDTESIVLAGGVSEAGAPFLQEIRDQIRQRGALSELAARRLRPEQVTLADREDPPGPRGAARIAAQSILRERDIRPASKQAKQQ